MYRFTAHFISFVCIVGLGMSMFLGSSPVMMVLFASGLGVATFVNGSVTTAVVALPRCQHSLVPVTNTITGEFYWHICARCFEELPERLGTDR